MDFSTLVAGPAQAGIQSPVSKPGIGLTAGAGAAPSAGAAGAAGESGFASLVALALDQLDGTSVGADGRTAGATCHAPRAEDDVEIGNAAASVDDDASVDGATLSVLIALATPIAAQVEAPAPEIVGQGSADLAAVDGDASGTAVTATVDAASPRAATTVPGTAARDFADALASATTTTSVGVAPVETTPVETTPATAIPTADTPAAPKLTLVAATGTMPQTIPDVRPAAVAAAAAPQAADDAASPAVPEAPAATETVDAAPAAAAPNTTTPTRAPRPAHPLRQALAAIAATTPAGVASPAAQAQPTTPATAAPRGAAAASPVLPEAAQAGQSGRDARVVTAPRGDIATLTAAPAAGASADASGEGPSDGARDAFRSATTLFAGVDGRIEIPTASIAQAATLDLASAAPVPALAGQATPADSLLRAIDMPAAARFEQALQSVDPDIRNVQAMVRTVRLFSTGDGASEARLTLEPEHLGPVALTVRIEQGSVSAHFRAETPAAHRWIETHQQELRSGLREQGLEVKEVVVTTDPDGRRERRQDAQPSRPSRARRSQSGADSPRFEVLV